MRLLASIFLFFSANIACAQTPGIMASGGQSPARIASVTANLSGSGPTIPANFIGFATDTNDLTVNGYYQGTSGNAASMISLIQMLGTNGVFLFGGSDSSLITPPNLTQAIANNAQSFLAGIGSGWASKVVYTLDLFANNSALAATQAGYMANAFGPSHMVFEFENEPFSTGHFATIGAYQSAWNAYYTAVTAAVTGAGYAPWADGDIQDAQSIISGLTPGLGGIAGIHYHRYGQGTTAAQLISYVVAHQFFMDINRSYLGPNVGLQRLSETQSLGSGGVAGISDRLMSATFLLNEELQVASLGYSGINIENRYAGQPVVYSPMAQLGDGNFTAAPTFYGMFLFSKIVGQQIVPSAVGGNANVVSIATKNGLKSNILVVNNDVTNPVVITTDQGSANVLQIKSATGAGCSDASLTIGGQPIGESGVWSGAPFSVSPVMFTLGPCEAALSQGQ